MTRFIVWSILFSLLLLAAGSGCDNSPKIVMPTGKIPPPGKPVAAGGGPARPAEPDGEPKEKPSEPKEKPAEAPPSEDK